nr:hypothetical protein GCM10020092_059320 [Actinoplanes digitatis]
MNVRYASIAAATTARSSRTAETAGAMASTTDLAARSADGQPEPRPVGEVAVQHGFAHPGVRGDGVDAGLRAELADRLHHGLDQLDPAPLAVVGPATAAPVGTVDALIDRVHCTSSSCYFR